MDSSEEIDDQFLDESYYRKVNPVYISTSIICTEMTKIADSFSLPPYECCDMKGQPQPTAGYCIECDQYLCDYCFKMHPYPRPCRHHRLLKPDQMPPRRVMLILPDMVPRECVKHEARFTDYLCKDHCTAGCVVCIAESHRCCSEVVHIPSIPEDKPDIYCLLNLSPEHRKMSIETRKNQKLRDEAKWRQLTERAKLPITYKIPSVMLTVQEFRQVQTEFLEFFKHLDKTLTEDDKNNEKPTVEEFDAMVLKYNKAIQENSLQDVIESIKTKVYEQVEIKQDNLPNEIPHKVTAKTDKTDDNKPCELSDSEFRTTSRSKFKNEATKESDHQIYPSENLETATVDQIREEASDTSHGKHAQVTDL